MSCATGSWNLIPKTFQENDQTAIPFPPNRFPEYQVFSEFVQLPLQWNLNLFNIQKKTGERTFGEWLTAFAYPSFKNTRWRFQPIWKNISQIGNLPQRRVKIKKMKPPLKCISNGAGFHPSPKAHKASRAATSQLKHYTPGGCFRNGWNWHGESTIFGIAHTYYTIIYI